MSAHGMSLLPLTYCSICCCEEVNPERLGYYHDDKPDWPRLGTHRYDDVVLLSSEEELRCGNKLRLQLVLPPAGLQLYSDALHNDLHCICCIHTERQNKHGLHKRAVNCQVTWYLQQKSYLSRQLLSHRSGIAPATSFQGIFGWPVCCMAIFTLWTFSTSNLSSCRSTEQIHLMNFVPSHARGL